MMYSKQSVSNMQVIEYNQKFTHLWLLFAIIFMLKSATECFRSGKGVVDWLLDVVVCEKTYDDSTINKTEKRRDDDLYIPIRRDEIMALAKVCVTNSLFLHKLGTMIGSEKKSSGDGIKGSLENNTHRLYCTFSIQ